MRHIRHLLLLFLLISTDSIEAGIDLNFDLGRRAARDPAVKCVGSLVGFRFLGEPGQVFVYAGERYEIGDDRYVELLAHPRRMTYTINGVLVPLQRGPADAFGFVDVRLPAPLPPPSRPVPSAG